MNVGDLVRPTTGSMRHKEENLGVVIGSENVSWAWVVVFWNDKYPAEVEDKDYLEVINECR
jgi:hypothetical protein